MMDMTKILFIVLGMSFFGIAMEIKWQPFDGSNNFLISVDDNEKNFKDLNEQIKQMENTNQENDQVHINMKNENIALRLQKLKNMIYALSDNLYDEATEKFMTQNCMLLMKISEYINKAADFKVRTQTSLIVREKLYFIFEEMGLYEFLKQNKNFIMLTDERQSDLLIVTKSLYDKIHFRKSFKLGKVSSLKFFFWIRGYTYYIVKNSTMAVFKTLLTDFIFKNNSISASEELNLIRRSQQETQGQPELNVTPSTLPWYNQWRWNW